MNDQRPFLLHESIEANLGGFGAVKMGRLLINERPRNETWIALTNEAGGNDIYVEDLSEIYTANDTQQPPRLNQNTEIAFDF